MKTKSEKNYTIKKGLNEDERIVCFDNGIKLSVARGWTRDAGGWCWVLNMSGKTISNKTIKDLMVNYNRYMNRLNELKSK